MTAQLGEGDGIMQLGDDIEGGAVMLRPIRFRCFGAWLSTALPGIGYISHTHTQFRLASDLLKLNYCETREAPLLNIIC